MMGDVGVGGWRGCVLLVSLFLSVCWLEKLMLSHGGFVVLDLVMYGTYDRNKCSGCSYRTTCALVCFRSLSFVNAFMF